MTPKQRAERSAEAMMNGDLASRSVGIALVDVDEGTAIMRMKVTQHHCNGHGVCHGGMTFTLADTAFAFACNSRNQSALAQHNTISYLAPGMLGDVLTAVATEVNLAGRNGMYDVTVTNQDGLKLAEFRGISRAIKGQLFAE